MSDLSRSDSPEGLEGRLRSLQDLTEFTESCGSQLREVFAALEWEPLSHTDSQQEQMEVCCFDKNHTVPCRSMEKHKTACQLVQLGYPREEQADMQDPSFCYEKTNIPCVKLDKYEQHQVILQARDNAPPGLTTGIYCQSDYSTEPGDVPQNHKRAICDLMVADRLALYDHVIQKAVEQRANAQSSSNEDLYVDLVSKLNQGDEQSGPKSHLEVLAEMRDYKRRRQSYRAKNVHITKKSYTEVIREVIDVHSEELAKLWQEEREEEAKTAQFQRKGSGEGRSASVDSHESHMGSREESGSHHRRHRKHSRDHSQERESKSRKRDSHSSDDRHHKKKKKKKTKS